MFVASSKGDVMENLDLKPAHFSLTEPHYKKTAFIKLKTFLIGTLIQRRRYLHTKHKMLKKTRPAATFVYMYFKSMKQKYKNSAFHVRLGWFCT